MLLTNILFVLKVLRKHKLVIALLVITQASLVLAFIVAYQFIESEKTKKNFFPGKTNIFLLQQKVNQPSYSFKTSKTSFFLGGFLKKKYPEVIEEFSRVINFQKDFHLVSIDEKNYFEKKVVAADNNFFDFFDVKIGPRQTYISFEDSAHLLISNNFVKKHFPQKSPVGKSLIYENSTELKIAGVINERNKIIPFDLFLPLKVLSEQIESFIVNSKDEIWNSTWTYLKINEKYTVDEVENLINQAIKDFSYETPFYSSKYNLIPSGKTYFDSQTLFQPAEVTFINLTTLVPPLLGVVFLTFVGLFLYSRRLFEKYFADFYSVQTHLGTTNKHKLIFSIISTVLISIFSFTLSLAASEQIYGIESNKIKDAVFSSGLLHLSFIFILIIYEIFLSQKNSYDLQVLFRKRESNKLKYLSFFRLASFTLLFFLVWAEVYFLRENQKLKKELEANEKTILKLPINHISNRNQLIHFINSLDYQEEILQVGIIENFWKSDIPIKKVYSLNTPSSVLLLPSIDIKVNRSNFIKNDTTNIYSELHLSTEAKVLLEKEGYDLGSAIFNNYGRVRFTTLKEVLELFDTSLPLIIRKLKSPNDNTFYGERGVLFLEIKKNNLKKVIENLKAYWSEYFRNTQMLAYTEQYFNQVKKKLSSNEKFIKLIQKTHILLFLSLFVLQILNMIISLKRGVFLSSRTFFKVIVELAIAIIFISTLVYSLFQKTLLDNRHIKIFLLYGTSYISIGFIFYFSLMFFYRNQLALKNKPKEL